MKTITDDRKRKIHFESITENYCNGNLSDAKEQVNQLSKIDLVRFINFIHFFGFRIYVDITGAKDLNLFETN